MLKRARCLTLGEFNQAASRLLLSTDNMALARQVLVEGMPIKLAVQKSGKERQAIHAVLNRVWHKFLELKLPPKEWVTVRLQLPAEAAQKAVARERELKQQLIENEMLQQ